MEMPVPSISNMQSLAFLPRKYEDFLKLLQLFPTNEKLSLLHFSQRKQSCHPTGFAYCSLCQNNVSHSCKSFKKCSNALRREVERSHIEIGPGREAFPSRAQSLVLLNRRNFLDRENLSKDRKFQNLLNVDLN